jgi:formylglycine-generating enzyme required for sulfatase activity
MQPTEDEASELSSDSQECNSNMVLFENKYAQMKIICLILVNLLIGLHIKANNIQVTNTHLVYQNTIEESVMVQFDISWENSWRLAGGPANWDAAWIFIKYRIGAGPWTHAFLHNTGHVSCEGLAISNGLLQPGAVFDPSTNPVMGVFLYRSEPGLGNIACQQVQLRWNYGENGLNDNTQVDIRVFAIEHVYIPAGAFTAGSGGTENGALYVYPNTTSPPTIANENALNVGPVSGNLYYNNVSGLSGDQTGPIPAAYPKGTIAFYAMKYEVSQRAYAEFLNTLTRAQQASRVRTNISGTSITNKFVLSNTSSPSFRNGVSCRTTIPAAPAPVDFFCNLNNNTIENEDSDGQCVTCNWLTWADLAAYMDWAALRPMSEFEFEKCARGDLAPVANEYVWGNHTINLLTSISNSGLPTELPSVAYVNCTGPGYNNPVRCGAFARNDNNRTLSGAGYYGCLDLGGNLWERGVTIGNSEGRAYTGVHGNGMLATNGNADVSQWPSNTTSVGSFLRGASFYTNFVENRTSNRSFAAWTVTGNESTGGRGVRTAPQ